MGNKLYVGNLPYSATNESLAETFGAHGSVTSARIAMDRDTGRSKGFGFVEMASDEEAEACIEKLNGSDLGGRTIVVNEARPPQPREGGSRGGFGGPRGGGRDGGSRGGFGGSRGGRDGGNRY